MSQENVEVVRQVYEAVARHDREAVLALYAADVVWDFSRSPIGEAMGRKTYRGHAGLRDWWRNWGDAWESYEDGYEELIDAGDHVVSLVTSRGRGRVSGAEVEWMQYGVWTLRAGKVARVEWLTTRDEALEAAGLSE
jgi:ketosteroid isomerase-like protein